MGTYYDLNHGTQPNGQKLIVTYDSDTHMVVGMRRVGTPRHSQGLTQTERQLAEWLIEATIGAIAFLFKGIGRLFGVRSY